MGQTMERMKEGYSKIRNEALAHAFAYMNLIEHWGSGIPRIMDKVKAWSTSRLKCCLMKMVSLLFRMIIN